MKKENGIISNFPKYMKKKKYYHLPQRIGWLFQLSTAVLVKKKKKEQLIAFLKRKKHEIKTKKSFTYLIEMNGHSVKKKEKGTVNKKNIKKR